MNVLASRTAGRRLLAIVSILVIPILLLGGIIIRNLREDITFTQKEVQGVALMELITPVLVGKTSGALSDREAEGRLRQGLAKAEQLGMAGELNELVQLYEAKMTRMDRLVEETAHSLHIVGLKSNLILDPEAETFFLALTTISNLPDLVADFHGFQFSLDLAIASGGIDQTELKRLLLMIGNLSESLDRSKDSLDHARESSSTPKSYENAVALIADMQQEVDVITDVVTTARSGSEALTLTMLAKQTIDPSSKYRMAAEVWQDTTVRLGNLLVARLKAMWIEFYIVVGVGLMCMFAAATGAFWMFRSTLRRLDLVEAEKQRADVARDEAEAMHGKLATINNDISNLNQELASKVLSLKEAQDELVQKGRLEQLGQLTATIAHEIRNPLGSVRTSAFLLERKLNGKGLGVETQIDRINKGVTRCDNIITQLLDFSRTKQLACKPGRLDDWLSQVVEEEANRLPLSVSIECLLGLGDREIPFDPARLQRAIVNLLNNACEAMVGAGDAQGKSTTPNPRIMIETRFEGGDVVLTVRDNGPGISAQNLDKIRQPLFTTKSFGTGLGVPAIEKILEQHGGYLRIESVEGEGAAFHAHLPVDGNPITAKAA